MAPSRPSKRAKLDHAQPENESRSSKKAKLSHQKSGKEDDASLQSLTSTSSTDSFDTFTCFPRLPTELRLKIWNMTVEPRTIQAKKGLWERGKMEYGKYTIYNETPVCLRVSKESRTELLRTYQLWLSTKRLLRHTHGVYVNPLMDTVVFNYYNSPWREMAKKTCNYFPIPTPHFTRNQTPQIKSIAFDFMFLDACRFAGRSLPLIPLEILATVEDMTYVIHTKPSQNNVRRSCHGLESYIARILIPGYVVPVPAEKSWVYRLLPGHSGDPSRKEHPLFPIYEKLAAARLHVRYCDGRLCTIPEVADRDYLQREFFAARPEKSPSRRTEFVFFRAVEQQGSVKPGEKVDTCQPFCSIDGGRGHSREAPLEILDDV